MRLLAGLFALSLVAACAEEVPDYTHETPMENVAFSADGWTQEDGFADPDAVYTVAVTLIRVDEDPRSFSIRDHWTREILAGLGSVDGLIGHSVSVHDDDGSGYGDDDRWAWTYTVWRDEESLGAFVESNLHQEGLPELGPRITDFSSGRWQVEARLIPEPWEMFWDRLEVR